MMEIFYYHFFRISCESCGFVWLAIFGECPLFSLIRRRPCTSRILQERDSIQHSSQRKRRDYDCSRRVTRERSSSRKNPWHRRTQMRFPFHTEWGKRRYYCSLYESSRMRQSISTSKKTLVSDMILSMRRYTDFLWKLTRKKNRI